MDPIPRIDVKHIEKFDGTNFQQWKHGLTMQLELSGLQDLVEVNVLPGPVSFNKGDSQFKLKPLDYDQMLFMIN
jgi:hypothetical protein